MSTIETTSLYAGGGSGSGLPEGLHESGGGSGMSLVYEGGSGSLEANGNDLAELSQFSGGTVIKKEMYFPSGSHAHDPEASAQFEADRAHRVESFQRQFKLRLGQAA